MIYIHTNKIDTIAQTWLILLKRYIEQNNYRQTMLDAIDGSSLSHEDKVIANLVVNRYYAHLDDYILAYKGTATLINNSYKYSIGRSISKKRVHKDLHEKLRALFSDLYDKFTKSEPLFDLTNEEEKKESETYKNHDIAYYFFKKLNIRTCPYCNRNYTFTYLEDNGKARPEYDHFYGQANCPLLVVSFYNLVPSCHDCNHTKLTKPLGINPYFEGFTSKFKVKYADSKLPLLLEEEIKQENLSIEFDKPSQDEKLNNMYLGLDHLYQMHDDYVMEMIEKARIYRGPMMDALSSTFQTPDYTPKDVFNFVWGKNLDTANHINRPLSKLTRDILEQLDIHVDDNL